MSKQNPVEVLEFKLDAMRSILADQSDSGPIHEDVYRVRRALSGMSAIAFNILRNPESVAMWRGLAGAIEALADDGLDALREIEGEMRDEDGQSRGQGPDEAAA